MRNIISQSAVVCLAFLAGCAANALPSEDGKTGASSFDKADFICDYPWETEAECLESYIGTDDGCDCGCAVHDPDCGPEPECSETVPCTPVFCVREPCPQPICMDGECVSGFPPPPPRDCSTMYCSQDCIVCDGEPRCVRLGATCSPPPPPECPGDCPYCIDCDGAPTCVAVGGSCPPPPPPIGCEAMICADDCIDCDGEPTCVATGASCPPPPPPPTGCEAMICAGFCIYCDDEPTCVGVGGSCPPPPPELCGSVTCDEGMVCCNPILSICTPPDAYCAFDA